MPHRLDPSLSRRALLRGGAAWLGAAAFPTAVQALLARQAQAGRPRGGEAVASPYGTPVPTLDQTTGLPLLKLPPGFTYRTFSWTGDPLLGGAPTPGNHDGMAVVQVVDNRTRDLVLIRNHELVDGANIGGSTGGPIYDPVNIGFTLGGGTTTLTFRRGQWIEARASLGGTVGNCCGGPTPWESWLTCEETITDGRNLGGLIHGFIFEVPAPSHGPASAVPLTDMGLFRHEAVAIDPVTGFAYETEDSLVGSGFYRFRPNVPNGGLGSLEQGGELDMLKVVGESNADLRLVAQGDTFDVEWVPIPEPALLPEPAVGQIVYLGQSGPYSQGLADGAATFMRLEGCWFANGSVYFTDTAGGAAEDGVLWRYDPPETLGRQDDTGRLTAVFVSSGRPEADNIDNVTVSPRGGIVMCEDGANPEGTRLVGLTPEGDAFPLAVNNVVLDSPPPGKFVSKGDYRHREWAGVCFDPSGRWMFANLYAPGITVAISGPWAKGPL